MCDISTELYHKISSKFWIIVFLTISKQLLSVFFFVLLLLSVTFLLFAPINAACRFKQTKAIVSPFFQWATVADDRLANLKCDSTATGC